MSDLKALRKRIHAVKSTRKISSAMQVVAASRLRKAQQAAENCKKYLRIQEEMISTLVNRLKDREDFLQMRASLSPLLFGTGRQDVHLVVVIASDRGLCGAFNHNVINAARHHIEALKTNGHTVKILPIGRRAIAPLKKAFPEDVVLSFENVGRKELSFFEADGIEIKIRSLFDEGEFDVCTIIYNRFKSAMTQIVTRDRIIPHPVGDILPAEAPYVSEARRRDNMIFGGTADTDIEPDTRFALKYLLRYTLAGKIFEVLLESRAAEQGARMTSMDNATHNADDILNELNVTYHRSRQAQITTELTEIISGAEAL